MQKHLLKQNALGSTLALAMLAAAGPAWSAVSILPATVTNGTVDASDTAPKATDNDYLTFMTINVTTQPNPVSFVVDLGGNTYVKGVGIYGQYLFDVSEMGFSGTVTVEAGNSSSGPFTTIGTITVPTTRPTGADPTTGGENPWTGGNGRMIPCTGTFATHLRISGGSAFDNHIRISHLQINPRAVVHRVDPVYQGTAFSPFDPGGGPNNSRVSVDLVDGSFATRSFLSPTGAVQPKLTLDIGTAQNVRVWRLHCSESDAGNNVKTGVLRVSSTDSPTNMDTVATASPTFNSYPSVPDYGFTQTPMAHASIKTTLANTKRFWQIETGSNMGGNSSGGNVYRIGEIDYRTVRETDDQEAFVVPGTTTGGPVQAGQAEDRAKNYLYNDWFEVTPPDQTTTVSFVMNLGGTRNVSSVGMYGRHTYLANQGMFSPAVFIEAGNSVTGPWNVIGMLNGIPTSRPTNADPAVGGENPWTGGNGRRIPCTPTDCTFIRISGMTAFDNLLDVAEILINPPGVIHEQIPVQTSNSTPFDVGGNIRNGRVAPELVDGDLATRANPQTAVSLVIDVGPVAVPVSEIRIFPMEADNSLLPNNITVKTSSTDNPKNMDTTVLSNFVPVSYSSNDAISQIPLPTVQTKRFFRLEFAQSSFNGAGNWRAGEIEFIRARPSNTVLASSVNEWSMY